MKKLSIEVEKQILHLYLIEELSTPAIGKIIGVSSTCITNIVKRNGHERRNISEAKTGRKRGTKFQIDKIKRLYVDEKQTIKQVANAIGSSNRSVCRLLEEMGIERRDNSEYEHENPNAPRIKELYESGLSVHAVAKAVNMSYTGVGNILRNSGIIRTELRACGMPGEKNPRYGKKWEKEYRDKVYEGRTGLNYEQYLAQLPEYEAYKKQVMSFTNKQALDTLPNFDKRGPSGQPGAYHLDHRFSIMEGFRQGIDPEIIGGIKNLEMLTYEENIAKLDGCSIDINNIC